jgi:hypothetical protein
MHQVYTANSVQESLVAKASRQSPSCPVHWMLPQGLFSLSKSDVRAGWPHAVLGQRHDELSKGNVDHRQRQVHLCNFAVL